MPDVLPDHASPYPMDRLESVPTQRRPVLRAMIESAGDGPFSWRRYPYSETDYLTDLWSLFEAASARWAAAADPPS